MLTGLVWLLLMGVVGLMLYFGIKFSHKQATTWTVIAEGQFAKLKVLEKLSSKRGGAAMYTSAQNLRKIGIIYFFDGNFVEAWGVEHVPAQRGEMIRVSENGHGECRVEKIK